MRFWRRKPPPPGELDLDRDSIPVDDPDDPTSVYMQIVMRHGTAMVQVEGGQWVLRVPDREAVFRGKPDESQSQMLQRALTELDR